MLIGIYSNSPQSGKDTVSKGLLELLEDKGIRCKLLKFAAPLKDMLRQLLLLLLLRDVGVAEGDIERYIEGDLKEDIIPVIGVTSRQMQKVIGMRFRDLNEDIWINILKEKSQENRVEIISDLRFENEFDFIRKSGGILVRVNRNSKLEDESEGNLGNHDFDFTIDNTGSLSDLEYQIRDLCNFIICKRLELCDDDYSLRNSRVNDCSRDFDGYNHVKRCNC